MTKHGNPRLRAPLVELAWRITGRETHEPGARKKAIVAVARPLAVDLWRWQTGQCTAEQLGLQP